ncbi:serine hydrolase domain-containing protein [Sphingomonas soli]|uniref:serine hydrolase domain-containing protein n=1 Tax=Sphingomonas soli TaxID=266127 RepID=UPI0008309009|nr:serine hydrolase [Sphingomonas soli]
MMKRASVKLSAAIALAALATGSALAQGREPVPPLGVPGPDADQPALLELRRNLLNKTIMPLMYHHMDSVFPTQEIARGGPVTAIPRAERPLNFSYTFAGETRPAEEVLERTFTNALLIIKDGRIVYERYRNLTRPDSRFMAMSVSKSITAILLGIAIDKGSIRSLDDLATDYVPELKGSAYEGVTVRDLVDMKSGVDRSDGDQQKPGSPGAARREDILVRNARPAVDEAFLVGRKEAPGKRFDYSTLNTTVLGWVIERATKTPITEYTSEMLWQPLGTERPAFWMTDGQRGKERPLTGIGFNATLRDYARIGLMMLNNGKYNGRQIVSARWVQESTAEPHHPLVPNASTGYQHSWWTVPGAAAYGANGVGGQYIYIDPATRTVIVKASYTPGDAREANAESNAFFKAASAWKGE